MVEQKNPELTSSHGHTKVTTIYRASVDVKDWKINRQELVQLKM